ncbi:MAG: hypothetical protein K6F69_01810 [Treponema sp.]|nr:hypothetical protein [Treponema sp.]
MAEKEKETVQTTKEEFDNWTSYDDWLIQNYDKYAIFNLENKDGKVFIEYCAKDDFAALKEQLSNNK